MVLGHFNKYFVKNTRKKGPTGKLFELFPPRYSENYILNEKFNSKMDTIWGFISESVHFFRFSRKDRGGFTLPPSCTPVRVAEYTLISLNIPKYP